MSFIYCEKNRQNKVKYKKLNVFCITIVTFITLNFVFNTQANANKDIVIRYQQHWLSTEMKHCEEIESEDDWDKKDKNWKK